VMTSTGKGKGRGHTLDRPLPNERTSLQKRSGMARVIERFHSFICTPTRLSTNGNKAYLALSSQMKLVLINRPHSDGRISWPRLDTTTVSKQSVQARYVTAITVVSRLNRHASLGNRSAWTEHRTHDRSGRKPRR